MLPHCASLVRKGGWRDREEVIVHAAVEEKEVSIRLLFLSGCRNPLKLSLISGEVLHMCAGTQDVI